MTMQETPAPLTPGTGGMNADTFNIGTAAPNDRLRQAFVAADPVNAAGVAGVVNYQPVTGSYGSVVRPIDENATFARRAREEAESPRFHETHRRHEERD